MSFKKALLVAVAVTSSAFITSAHAANITYLGTDTEGDVRVNYSITTDGTLGGLLLSNIIASSITYIGLSTQANNNHNFTPFTAYNSIYFTHLDDNGDEVLPSPISATSTDLYFDFGGAGDLNMGPVNCAGINDCSSAMQAAPNAEQQGLVFALASANTNEYASVVYHEGNLPAKEIDDFYRSQNFRLQDGFYTKVAATNQIIASVAATAAVPEPSSWAMMLVGLGATGYTLRRRGKATSGIQAA